jgi:hypothetical protein
VQGEADLMDRSIKHWLKAGRWRLRRAGVALRWGAAELSRTPAVLGNAMPKSGSHLIIQVLQGLTRIGPFVNPGFPPVNRTESNRILLETQVCENIKRMLPGDIRYGYIHAREPFITLLTRPGMATVFVYRDPRDMIVSHVFYATEIYSGHALHEYYTQELATNEERINAAIKGLDTNGLKMRSVSSRYAAYLGWMEHPEVLCLRFEDLILHQETAIARMLEYLEGRGYSPRMPVEQAVARIRKAIQPAKSGTFRKGIPGNWREHFTEGNKQVFKEEAGDLVIRLGYEKDSSW